METFVELSLIIVIAASVAAIMKLLKQPIIIGHILTGLIVGPYVLNIISSEDTFRVFSHLGVSLLLFIVGLNLSPRVIREVGKTAIFTGIGQVLFTTLIGFILCKFIFKFNDITSLYIAISLTFSSTIIVLKLLGDKGDLQKLFGKISVGFLLVQDIIALIILIIVSSFGKEETMAETVLFMGIKTVILLIILGIISIYILPRLDNFFAKSQEMLFLFSSAWGLGLAVLFYKLGFSIEIGALAAGVSLSVSPYHYEISARLKPLRDFFIVVFFVLLGSQVAIADARPLIVPALVLSIFVLIGNPLMVIFLMGILGYNKKVSFLSGLTVAQISEFSLILIMLGVRIGHIDAHILSLLTIIGLITIAVSSYFIIHSDSLYLKVNKFIPFFINKSTKRNRFNVKDKYDMVLFGYNRIGFDILRSFFKISKRFLVVDFNPDVIKNLFKQGVNCIYGDASDNEFLNDLNLRNVKMVVSTIPDFETNVFLIEKIKRLSKRAIIIVISHNIKDAYRLYKHGASYVIMPHFLGGKYASMLIRRHKFNAKKFKKIKDAHIKYLNKRRSLGHEHPILDFK